MLKSISWEDYGLFILITLVIYYTVIVCIYYRNQLTLIFADKKIQLFKNSNSKDRLSDDKLRISEQLSLNANGKNGKPNDILPILDEFSSEIKFAIKYAADNDLSKPEIIFLLQTIVKKYLVIKDTSHQPIITNYTLSECALYSSISLNEDEVNRMWLV